MRILVVDDHPMIVQDIVEELSEIDPKAECIGTSDPFEVMGLFEKEPFDVVMMDIDMPGLNGLNLAKLITEKYPRINIIFITGYENYALESYNNYASDFIVKPVNTRRLRRAIENLRYPVSNITKEMIAGQYSGGEALGAQIRRCREESGISRMELADRMSVSMQTVYRWESGERMPSVVTLMEIARVLGADMDRITGLKG